MLSITSLIKSLKLDYPQFNFQSDGVFQWSHDDQTIHYDQSENNPSYIIHELSHAVLGHKSYQRDIELIAMERQAWEKSKELASHYKIKIDDDFIQYNLDTYRDWLHTRSTCPSCEVIGLQTDANIYKCPNCNKSWRVNEARTKALRRYKLKKQ